jgi:hypothetical protein
MVCSSCTQVKKTEKPDPFYDQGKMVDIMTDMYLMEGVMSSNRKAFLKLAVRPDSFLYKKYTIDSLSYENNFYYYMDRIEKYEVILDQVQLRLEGIKDEFNKVDLEKSISEQESSQNDTIINDTINKKQKRVLKKSLSPQAKKS